jgi:hypothetical protein
VAQPVSTTVVDMAAASSTFFVFKRNVLILTFGLVF